MSMTALGEILRRRIAADGPLDLGDYMDACLADPDHGYYQQQTPFGVDGDFITAPEISGMFGEMCGLYLAHMYEIAKSSLPTTATSMVTELGPGRGTLMRDMRHVWAQLMPEMKALPVHFVETSQALRAQQAAIMDAGTDGNDGAHAWHNDIKTVPDGPLFGVANEFFDALPVSQFTYQQKMWYRRLVGWNDEAGAFGFVEGAAVDTAMQSRLSASLSSTKRQPDEGQITEGQIAELCPAADIVMDHLAQRIARFGGAILIIDYGQSGSTGDTLQAVATHRPVDVFFEPGHADLSHWVDFRALGERAALAGARLVGPVPQGRFLMRIGLGARAEQAAATADPQTRRALLAAIDRLTSPAQMGEAFKVALLIPEGTGVPPGFEVE